MNKQNLDDLALDEENRLEKRQKRKRRRMKVSGARLKELQKIIVSSSQK